MNDARALVVELSVYLAEQLGVERAVSMAGAYWPAWAGARRSAAALRVAVFGDESGAGREFDDDVALHTGVDAWLVLAYLYAVEGNVDEARAYLRTFHLLEHEGRDGKTIASAARKAVAARHEGGKYAQRLKIVKARWEAEQIKPAPMSDPDFVKEQIKLYAEIAKPTGKPALMRDPRKLARHVKAWREEHEIGAELRSTRRAHAEPKKTA